jgi:hypothetical protein
VGLLSPKPSNYNKRFLKALTFAVMETATLNIKVNAFIPPVKSIASLNWANILIIK